MTIKTGNELKKALHGDEEAVNSTSSIDNAYFYAQGNPTEEALGLAYKNYADSAMISTVLRKRAMNINGSYHRGLTGVTRDSLYKTQIALLGINLSASKKGMEMRPATSYYHAHRTSDRRVSLLSVFKSNDSTMRSLLKNADMRSFIISYFTAQIIFNDIDHVYNYSKIVKLLMEFDKRALPHNRLGYKDVLEAVKLGFETAQLSFDDDGTIDESRIVWHRPIWWNSAEKAANYSIGLFVLSPFGKWTHMAMSINDKKNFTKGTFLSAIYSTMIDLVEKANEDRTTKVYFTAQELADSSGNENLTKTKVMSFLRNNNEIKRILPVKTAGRFGYSIDTDKCRNTYQFIQRILKFVDKIYRRDLNQDTLLTNTADLDIDNGHIVGSKINFTKTTSQLVRDGIYGYVNDYGEKVPGLLMLTGNTIYENHINNDSKVYLMWEDISMRLDSKQDNLEELVQNDSKVVNSVIDDEDVQLMLNSEDSDIKKLVKQSDTFTVIPVVHMFMNSNWFDDDPMLKKNFNVFNQDNNKSFNRIVNILRMNQYMDEKIDYDKFYEYYSTIDNTREKIGFAPALSFEKFQMIQEAFTLGYPVSNIGIDIEPVEIPN